MLVIHPYHATMEDEMNLDIGDMVKITKQFEDDWGLGYNHTSRVEATGAYCDVGCQSQYGLCKPQIINATSSA